VCKNCGGLIHRSGLAVTTHDTFHNAIASAVLFSQPGMAAAIDGEDAPALNEMFALIGVQLTSYGTFVPKR